MAFLTIISLRCITSQSPDIEDLQDVKAKSSRALCGASTHRCSLKCLLKMRYGLSRQYPSQVPPPTLGRALRVVSRKLCKISTASWGGYEGMPWQWSIP